MKERPSPHGVSCCCLDCPNVARPMTFASLLPGTRCIICQLSNDRHGGDGDHSGASVPACDCPTLNWLAPVFGVPVRSRKPACAPPSIVFVGQGSTGKPRETASIVALSYER
jgi:hypothetical protein